MRKRWLAACVLLGITSACGGAGGTGDIQGGGTADAAAVYDNLTVGRYRTMAVTTDTTSYTETSTVVARSATGFTLQITNSDTTDIWESDYVISGGAESLALSRSYRAGVLVATTTFTPPVLMLGGDRTTGATANCSSNFVTSSAAMGSILGSLTKTLTVNGIETITVPAGTYAALKVTAVQVNASRTIFIETWWAPGIGLAKKRYYWDSISGQPAYSSVLTAVGP